ncbi:unnamed protein product [Lampetra planeri]
MPPHPTTKVPAPPPTEQSTSKHDARQRRAGQEGVCQETTWQESWNSGVAGGNASIPSRSQAASPTLLLGSAQ